MKYLGVTRRLMLFFVATPWQQKNLVRGLILTQWALILPATIFFLRFLGVDLKSALSLRIPTGRSVAIAVLWGCSAWILVNTLASLLAGVLPVPGGIGVMEAAIAGGLVAAGVPESTAVAAAILYRMVTFYLPPIWGAYAMRSLRQKGYV